MKNMPVDSYIEESHKWEDLSIPEKAEMMKVAIRNGITSLPEIKQAYKEFAEGGNLYKGGGQKKQRSFGNAGSQRAMQYFMNKGLTQAQAAGLVGNLMRESGMQSNALNSSSKAFGIAQWLGPRKKALFARYGSNPTLDQQLDFVWHELNTTHRNGLRHLKASKTAAEAARNVMGYYEFSAGPEAAIAAMNRTGQAGNKSMLRGIEYASKLLGIPVSAEDYTPAVQENPLVSPVSDVQQMIQFTPWNPQAFYGYQAPQIEIPMEQPVQNIPTFTKEDVERAQRQQGMETFMALSNLLQPTNTPEAVVPRQRNNPYIAYQEGGNLFKEGGPKASSERIYDILPSLYAMDGVNVIASSKVRKGSTVIKDGKDTGRPSRHASGLAVDIVPGKGSTFADMFRVLRDPNSNVSRYLQSVGGGYLDETSATGTTKYWHDHNSDHSHIHHQIGGYAGANYGKEIASILGGKASMSTPSTQEQSSFLAFEPANPMAFFNPAAFQTPVIERPVVEPLVEEADVYSQKMQEIEDRRNNLNKLNVMLSLTSPSQSGNSLMSTIGMLTGNYSANGGPIHIKPSHRGRLTELKERTGKTEAELKHDGNPAHKKMVVFAENARKWHGLGGNLYDGLTEGSQQMETGGVQQGRTSADDTVLTITVDGIPYNITPSAFDAKFDLKMRDSEGNPREMTPELKAKIFEGIADAKNNRAVLDAQGSLEYGNQNTAELLPYEPVDNNDIFAPLGHVAKNYFDELNYRAKTDPSSIALQGKYTMPVIAATALLPWLGEAAASTSIAGIPATTWANTAAAAGFAGHGLNHAINEGIDGWGDATMTALEVTPLGRLAKPMWNAGKEGLQYAAKAADNATRYMSPSYDLYRTIGETTPRTTPTYHGFRLNGEQAYTGSPLFEFGQTIGTSSEKAYFMRAPKDVDVLKLGNGKFRHEVVGNNVLPSGEVNGKFVSYGEPWQEFALGENSALYEFPVGPRRGPSLMATDWKGRPQKYSVDEVYDYMQQEEALRNELASIEETMGDDFLKQYSTIRRNLINEKYPALKEHIDTSVYGANQTVIPNERWNFDKFLKTPFWKYSENPLSGQVQKEIMMRWPEAKHLETPTIEWTDAVKTPQITAENAASITPEVTTLI